jgi:hypothetical protein
VEVIVKELLIRFASWRAEMARRLNGILFWRELTDFCRRVSLPLTGLAQGTLRVFPFLRKLEWLLEIESLTRRHPVVLVFTLAFVLIRGLKYTPLGHIATDKAIYPFVALVSGYNPFLGMLCGISYGVGDLIQKFFLPDIYGAGHWSDGNFWGAMAGYVVAYSSLMIMGLAPGMASRACRAAAAAAIRSYFRNRATAMADGAVPLVPSPAPLVEIAAGAVGAFAAGWTVLHEVAPVTERPAFYWRPQPDVSCHNLEVATHLQKPAPTVGGIAAAGAAIPVVAPPAPPVPPPPPQEPQYPDEIEWAAPDGKRHVLVRNEQGQYINILTGGMVDVTNLDAWKQSWSNIIADHQQWGRQQMEKLENRDTAFEKAMDAWVAEQKEKEKIFQNLSKMEKNILFGDGPESHLYKPPGQPGNILDHIHDLQDQIIRGKPLDKEKYQKIFNIYKKTKLGEILTEDMLPTSGEITRDIIRTTFTTTASEFVFGEKSDGSTSWLGLGGRALTAALTGGLSEIVLTPVDAVKSMKDYVDAGGNSIIGGFISSAGAVAMGEVMGLAGGLISKGAHKLGAAAGDLAGEFLENAAKKGNTAAQQALDAAASAKKGLNDLASSLQEALSGKKPAVTAGVKQPPQTLPTGLSRAEARAGSGTAIQILDAGVPAEQLTNGYTANSVKHAKMVADKYGVILDLRPTNPASRPLIESGAALPKPPYVKNKTLTEMDQLLGAKGKPGTVGHYMPELPPKGNMSDAQYEELKKLYNSRKKEYIEESIQISKLKAEGKIEVRDGTIFDKKSGKPLAGDIDIFDIRDPVTGKPIPRYQVDHKGNLLIDPATGQPKLNPVREQIIKELKNGPFQAQHGAHMDWKYDHLPSKHHDKMIDDGVIGKHQHEVPVRNSKGEITGYKPGEPLVAIGPNGQMSTIRIKGGR